MSASGRHRVCCCPATGCIIGGVRIHEVTVTIGSAPDDLVDLCADVHPCREDREGGSAGRWVKFVYLGINEYGYPSEDVFWDGDINGEHTLEWVGSPQTELEEESLCHYSALLGAARWDIYADKDCNSRARERWEDTKGNPFYRDISLGVDAIIANCWINADTERVRCFSIELAFNSGDMTAVKGSEFGNLVDHGCTKAFYQETDTIDQFATAYCSAPGTVKGGIDHGGAFDGIPLYPDLYSGGIAKVEW